MMKNLSLALNIILLAAVGYLYYYNFSGKKKDMPAMKNEPGTTWKDSVCQHPLIAYVELDSLNENITSIKNERQALESEQKKIESDWAEGYKSLDAQKNTFLKKGAAITQDEAEKFQAQLYAQQQKIDGTKQALTQNLSQRSFSFMDGIQKKLKKFLIEYNKDKKYMYILTTGTGLDYMVYKDTALNITDDVIKGMNEEMKSPSKE